MDTKASTWPTIFGVPQTLTDIERPSTRAQAQHSLKNAYSVNQRPLKVALCTGVKLHIAESASS